MNKHVGEEWPLISVLNLTLLMFWYNFNLALLLSADVNLCCFF